VAALGSLVEGRPRLADVTVLIAGCLFPLGFSPFDLWPLGICALAVLVATVAPPGVSTRRGSWRFYLFAVGMYGVGTSWIYVSIHEHGGASQLLAGTLVALFVLGFSALSWVHGWLFMRFVKPLVFGMVLGFPLAWLLREWTFTWFLTGFPWLLAGYAHLDTALAGYVPVIGVLGLGCLIALQASLLAVLAARWRPGHGFVIGVIAGIWVAGLALSQAAFVRPAGEPLTAAAVQGNVDQRTKWNRDMVGPIIDTYLGLTNGAWDTNLIVWPEAAITLFRDDARSLLDVLGRRAASAGSTLVLGIPDRSESGQFWNTAIAVGEGEGRYIKRRLVPFGEYVPLEGLLRGTIDFFDLPMSRNEAGPWKQPPLRMQGLDVTVSICYEIVYPDLVRSPMPGGGPPDLLVTISNDTWFGDSIGPSQHLQMARARALENGRYLIRATNNGITAFVDANGVITARLPRFEPGILHGEVRRMTGRTPWSMLGSLPLVILAAGCLAGLAIRTRHVSATAIG